MYNYTKTDTLNILGGRKVKEVAEEVGCHAGTVYAYLEGNLSETSPTRQKIDQLLQTGSIEIKAKPSLKEETGLSVNEIAELAEVSRASVYNWHNRKVKNETPSIIDYKIEALLKEHQLKN